MDQQAAQKLLVFFELIGDPLIVHVDHAVDHRKKAVIPYVSRQLLLLSGIGHLRAPQMKKDVGELASRDRDLKLLLHGLQDSDSQFVIFPKLQVSHLLRDRIERSALLEPLDHDGDVNDKACIGAVR